MRVTYPERRDREEQAATMNHVSTPRDWQRFLPLACLAAGLPAFLGAGPSPSVTIEIKDYVELPITGKLDGTGQTDGELARLNSLHEEPGGARRFFINDLNGP